MKSLPIRRTQFKTADFAAWLARNGAELGTPTNPYEVIRYKAHSATSKRAETHIVYAKESGLLTFTGASREHYVQFATGAAMFPDPFHVPKAKRPAPEMETPGKAERRRRKLLERDGDGCWFCGLPMGDDCTIEHLVPRSAGGRDALANYALAHRRCNADAADMPLTEKIELRSRLRDSDRHSQSRDRRARAEGCQSGGSVASASPNLSPNPSPSSSPGEEE
jgi:hypothetical protein